MPFVSVLPQDAVGCDTSADGYYDEAKGRADNTGRKPISARDAHRCWTSAMRTSENSVNAKFAEIVLDELRRTPLWRSSLCSIAPPRTESYVDRGMSL